MAKVQHLLVEVFGDEDRWQKFYGQGQTGQSQASGFSGGVRRGIAGLAGFELNE